jgi:ubiquinone/menaquinone biosynthesis C-methylase UbiE
MTFTRHDLARLYAFGSGIEIGAYHNPFPYSPMTYIDKWPYETLLKMAQDDPHVRGKVIVKNTLVGDGQWLSEVKSNSFDFLVSSHQLEHCESPITAIKNHLRVIKSTGFVIYAIPDMRFTFDKDRPLTTLEHVLLDYLRDSDKHYHQIQSRLHYDDWLSNVDKIQDQQERNRIAQDRMSKGLDIHFHTWTFDTLLEMFLRIRREFKTFEIELAARAGHENFVVIKKV